MVQAGQYVTDGTAVFLVCDIRDGAQVGDIKMSPVLRNGYVQANGALLPNASTNYPRLISFLADNPSLKAVDDTAWNANKALYVYDDTNDTLRVPDATGRVLQGGNTVEEKEVGLPEINGKFYAYPYYTGANVIYTSISDGEAFSYTPGGGSSSPFGVNFSNASVTTGLMTFKASNSNSIYGNSNTVQPPAITLIPQIKY